MGTEEGVARRPFLCPHRSDFGHRLWHHGLHGEHGGKGRGVAASFHWADEGAEAHPTSTADSLCEWIKAKGLVCAAGAVRRYRDGIEAFAKHRGDKATRSLAGVNARDMGALRDEQLRAGKANRTANVAVKTLRIPLNLARRQGLILSNPAEAVEMLPENSGERDAFTREQIASRLNVADIEWRGMILMGACHGLWLGGAARLSWASVDLERKAIRFVKFVVITRSVRLGPKTACAHLSRFIVMLAVAFVAVTRAVELLK